MGMLVRTLEQAALDELISGKYKMADTPHTRAVASLFAREVVTEMMAHALGDVVTQYLWYEAHHVPLANRAVPSKLFKKGSIYNP